MYGARYVGNLDGGTAPIKKFLIKAAEVIAKGDWLTVDATTGKVDVVTTAGDEPLLGLANETITGNSGGTNKVEVILAMPGTLFLMDNDNTTETFAQDDVGEWQDTAGATGASLIDTNKDGAAPTTGKSMLLCLEYNPQGFEMDGDTSIGLYTPTYTYFSSSYTE